PLSQKRSRITATPFPYTTLFRSVPNHMLGQFSTELLALYPAANILAAGKEDFESQNRRELFSRIATGNWDAVIVTHSGFEKIPLDRKSTRQNSSHQIMSYTVFCL